MTPEQIALVEATVDAAGPRLDEVAAALHRRLFLEHPELVRMFPGDPTAQRATFAEEIVNIVSGVRAHTGFLAAGRDLGRRHREYGLRAAHYGMMGSALLEALAGVLGDGWTADVEEAWRLAYNLSAETMMAGAGRPRQGSSTVARFLRTRRAVVPQGSREV